MPNMVHTYDIKRETQGRVAPRGRALYIVYIPSRHDLSNKYRSRYIILLLSVVGIKSSMVVLLIVVYGPRRASDIYLHGQLI